MADELSHEVNPLNGQLVPTIEALLFVSAAPVELKRLEHLLGVERTALDVAVDSLAEQCLTRGLRLQRHKGSVQLVTAPEAAPFVERLLGYEVASKLSPAAMETLSVVAYEQPVTRARIESTRGVNSDRALASLVARGLVEEVGRLETAGRPALFGTTPEFLQYFGLQSVEDLPPLPEEHAVTEDTAAASPS